MIQLSPLIGFGFGSGWMLAWSLAAGIPILIHYWNKRRYAQTDWAAMQFLLAALDKRSRRLHLEQILLLAIRIAIILALAFALADPFISSSTSAGDSSIRRVHTVLVVDTSYSMSAKSNGETALESAKQLAKRLVAESRSGDSFTLLTMGEPPKAVIAVPSIDAQQVVEEIDRLAVVQRGADLNSTLDLLEDTLRNARTTDSNLSQRVCFYTDLAVNTWQVANTDNLDHRINAIAKSTEITLVQANTASQSNLAITNLRQSAPIARTTATMEFDADVANFGDNAVEDATIELLVDGQIVDSQHIDVEAKINTTVTLRHQFSTAGQHRIHVRSSADAIELDNHIYRVISVAGVLRTLCVGSDYDATDAIANALAPTDDDAIGVTVDRATEFALTSSSIGEYDCIVLANLRAVGTSDLIGLRRFLELGGGLVFFLGDKTQIDSFNELLYDTTNPILPAKVEGAVHQTQRFDPRQYDHGIVAPFLGNRNAGLLTVPIWKYYRVTPQTEARVALWFEGGDPAIVERAVAGGRTILITTNATIGKQPITNQPWSALPLSPCFPPLMQTILVESVKGRFDDREYTVGDVIDETVEFAKDRAVTITRPDNVSDRIVIPNEERATLSYGPADLSGFYAIADSPEPSTPSLPTSQHQFAVNVDTRESLPGKVAIELLPEAFRSSEFTEEVILASGQSEAPVPMHQIALAVLFALLTLEPLVAWSFGSG